MAHARPASALLLALALASAAPANAEDPRCLSGDPNDWPASSRPYFMLAVDTSGSMTACTTPPTTFPKTCDPFAPGFALNACGLEPTRLNDAKCALHEAVLAFGGQVHFGLATYATKLDACPANCESSCAGTLASCQGVTPCCTSDTYGCASTCFPLEKTSTGNCAGCGPRTGGPSTRAGAFIRVPMQIDALWSTPTPSNVPALLEWVDGDCGSNHELFASGATPLNGMLRDMARYFATGWTAPDGSVSYLSPLSVNDLAGAGVNGSTGCRSVNVILVTDGDETCDTQADAVEAAANLYQTGVTIGGKTFKIRTHVVNFAGGTQANTDAIAAAGGTGKSLFASNGSELASALSEIVATAVKPETCNNADDNCNGCTDEGYLHYCNLNAACCSWSDAASRRTCLDAYLASVQSNPPSGDAALLPCTSATQGAAPSTWLCFDAGETCNGLDDNCQFGIDESQQTCGAPAHCPASETCNGQDDDCDGQTDEGVCANCIPTTEICDGCDNDCDGVIDDPPPGGFPTLACGLPAPPNCKGTATCKAPVAAPQPGACLVGSGYASCQNAPAQETCDGSDNDCDGQTDEGFVSSACKPASHPAGLSYAAGSQCTKGMSQCQNGAVVCVGGTGPSEEICDGIDNDCDGMIDDAVLGIGKPCGSSTLPCTPGTTACEGGQIVCKGGSQPKAEVCDGIDNDCDGKVDDAPLADGPAPGESGCWSEAGSCCSFGGLSWCPPAGAACHGLGALTSPCSQGALQCAGAKGWQCVGPKSPQSEICDGSDDDCDGLVDEAPLPLVGGPCGSDVGACEPGLLACALGSLDCVGDLGPVPESCNGIDDDCDGVTDEGIPPSGTCAMAYDAALFPGDRSGLPCQPGLLECDGAGQWVCQGGVAPGAEVCNAIDDDCDGEVDELGDAPDGMNGSANPFAPPVATLGQACGQSAGACQPGAFACVDGAFACVGAIAPQFEACNCADDDCDGSADELPGPNEPALCSPGKSCVSAGGACQCAAPCEGGEYPCPAGQKCVKAKVSGADTEGGFCVVDLDAVCGDCASKTAAPEGGSMGCAPAGTDPAGCTLTPVCRCKGESGCREPCFGVACPAGQVCARFGEKAGQCVLPTCYLTGCEGCGTICIAGACRTNPCGPDSCPGQGCKPNESFTAAVCFASCAGVACPDGTSCVAGQCQPTCDPACPLGQECNTNAPGGPTCVPSKCATEACASGAWCDPLTGLCKDAPCTGVVCPTGQSCSEGQCVSPGASAEEATSGSSITTATQKMVENGACSCDAVGAGPSRPRTGTFVLLGLAALAARLLRRRTVAGVVLATSLLGGCKAASELDPGFTSGSTGSEGSGGTLFSPSTSSGDLGLGTGGASGCVLTNGGVERCDGTDNDCDGLVDEDFDFHSIKRCGTCTNDCFAEFVNADPKSITCDWNGEPNSPGTCSFAACATDYVDLDPSKPGCEYYCIHTAEDDAACNHKDDDCDGTTDEDVDLCSDRENCGTCGRSCNVIHGTGACAHPDPATPCDISHTACIVAACNDDDQDGSPDWWNLDGVDATGCEYPCSLTNGGVEMCGDGIDNDCDGLIDAADDLSGDPALGLECFGDPDGICASAPHAGTTVCQGHQVVCVGPELLAENQVPETCNGLDDDCDGVPDDATIDSGSACGASNQAPCAFGKLTCNGGVLTCVGSVDPGVETCNGIDDDCDGKIDRAGGLAPKDATGACNVPPPAPLGATSPCKAGSLACVGGTIQCQGWVGPSSATDACGEDSNCNGTLEGQPDVSSDVHHCGTCANDCAAKALHAQFACKQSQCTFLSCDAGWYDLDANQTCEYGCVPTGSEQCDGIDNDCNGKVDDGLLAPAPAKVCGVSVAATRPECTTGVKVTCSQGTWSCAFPAGVCGPSCSGATEICDALDNDCDGLINENIANFGLACASDDGLPFPGHGACRTVGTFVCAGANATTCSATKADCALLPGGCVELCDGLDNDCDGSVDESFVARGANADHFVRPEVTQISDQVFMFAYEAARTSATATSAGAGNGYTCSTVTCPPWLSPAPGGVALDATVACSNGGRLPWFNVTPIEAEQACDALGGRVCTLGEWQMACRAESACSWGYSPRGDACRTPSTADTVCNLLEFDYTTSVAGDQNGLLPGGSPRLAGCGSDWSSSFGNAAPYVHDVTGNLREIVYDDVAGTYRLMGGGFNTTEGGATCSFTFYAVAPTYQLYDTGFRCCFDTDPRL